MPHATPSLNGPRSTILAMLLAWLAPLRNGWRARFAAGRRASQPEPTDKAAVAAELLGSALAEDDPALRIEKLRAAIRFGEELAGPPGDIIVMEASLHLGEKLRAIGARDEAIAHLTRAVERSFRVEEPIGRHRRAGVLTRLGLLDQEHGEGARARQHYEEALRLGADADSDLLLGMLTQAAFNLGLLDTDGGDEDAAIAHWQRAIELGARAGHASGWDPAAIAAFNLGHLHARRGEREIARTRLEEACRLAEPAGTPLGLMAAAKAALALATLAEQEGLLGEMEAVHQYERALMLGRASGLPEGVMAAMQAAMGLGEQAGNAGQRDAAIVRYREALTLAPAADPDSRERFHVLAQLRLGQTLAEAGAREEAALLLREAFARGRASAEPWVRELAAQAAVALHRLLGALDRWDEARLLATQAAEFAATLETPMGRALAVAARHAHAFQQVHDGEDEAALDTLGDVADLGLACGHEMGERVAIDALLLAGHLERQAGRAEASIAHFKRIRAHLRGVHEGEADTLAAMAAVNSGHCLLQLERRLEARHAYEDALARGRACGQGPGRAAAANAALNLTALLEGEAPMAQRVELAQLAIALGRSSATTLGSECAVQGARAIVMLEGEEADGDPEGE